MQKIKNILKNQDKFGYQIGFTHKDQHSYKTGLGGFATVMALMGLLIYFAVLVNQAYN